MLKNILLFDGKEFLYSSRTLGYLKRYYPRLEIKCADSPKLDRYIGGAGGFQTPVEDNAPWIKGGSVTHAPNFLGGLITGLVGIEDSTQVGNYTEIKDEGGVHHQPHFGMREFKVTATLFARTERALDFGIDWVKAAIDTSFCGKGFGANCNGNTVDYYIGDLGTDPATDYAGATSELARNRRTLMNVKVLSGVKVTGYPKFKSTFAATIEFVMIAGSPFAFNYYPNWTASLRDGTTQTSVAEQECSPVSNAYSNIITDPADGAVARPPRPPAIDPLPMPSTWTRRQTTHLPESVTDTWGQLVFKIEVYARSTMRQFRIRFYPDSATPGLCGYTGEFYVTYIPGGYTLTIDGRTKEIYMVAPGSTKRQAVPNLVLGSQGRPLDWPVIDCRTAQRIEFDTVGDITQLDASISAYLRR